MEKGCWHGRNLWLLMIGIGLSLLTSGIYYQELKEYSAKSIESISTVSMRFSIRRMFWLLW